MAQIEIKLEKQLLTIQNREVISSGDVNYDSCRFEFDESWEGYTKTAVFYQEKQRVYYAILDNENKCYIPAPAIVKASPLYIGVFGVLGNKILTSSMDSLPIVEGAISGAEVDIEPSDTVFAAIVASYQAILDTITKQNQSLDQTKEILKEQNRILETINAFDVVEVSGQLLVIKENMILHNKLAQELIDREVILKNIPIRFVDGECVIQNELITDESLCDVYFDEYSYEFALKALILVSSYDGYIRITSSENIEEELRANILVRRY